MNNTDRELEIDLDKAYEAELAQAAKMVEALKSKAEWDAFVGALVEQAKREGRDLVLRSIPVLAAALRTALVAAVA